MVQDMHPPIPWFWFLGLIVWLVGSNEIMGIQAQPLSGTVVAYDECAISQDWVRPTPIVQSRKLRESGRYRDTAQNRAIQTLLRLFWDGEAIAFTSYSLSARIDPIYLSGLWTVQEKITECYNSLPLLVTDLNQGRRVEVWLLLHEVVSLQWTGQDYLLIVRPLRRGAQMISFHRWEARDSLPLQVRLETGEILDVVKWGQISNTP